MPEFLNIKSELTRLMKSSQQADTIQGKIEVILSNEDQFTRLFTEKYKHIKFSLYLFTEDAAGGRDGPFQRADQD